MNRTGIEWTEYSWNPLRGCTRVSEGCRNCYAERVAARFSTDIDLGGGRSMANLNRRPGPFDGVAIMAADGPRWTGRVELFESKLTEPLRKRKPSVIFVNSMSDTFHEKVPDEWIDRMFAVMALCPQHRFTVLTKRAKRMREWFTLNRWERVRLIAKFLVGMQPEWDWPLPNVGLGVSVEDRKHKDRIDELRQTPTAMRFLSLEPLLEDLGTLNLSGIFWVIVGGESGPGARPMPPEWPRAIRDQCIATGVPYFHKQNGEWFQSNNGRDLFRVGECEDVPVGDGTHHRMFRVGKRAAGQLLDGKVWDQMPEGWI